MTKIIFLWWLITGTVVPSEMHEGHQMYNIIEDDSVIENAYKGEIINYIETGEFVYDDFYEFPDEECYSKN